MVLRGVALGSVEDDIQYPSPIRGTMVATVSLWPFYFEIFTGR